MHKTAINVVGHRVLILFRRGPDEAVGVRVHFDVGCGRIPAKDRSKDFSGLGRERGNVHKLCNFKVVASFGDDASAVGVADQDNWAIEMVERAIYSGHIFVKRSERNPRGSHRKTPMGQVCDYFAPDGSRHSRRC